MSLRTHLTGANVALIAVFAGFIAASTLVPEITLAGGIPLSLQTFAVVLAGLALGPWRGGAAVVLYLVVGLAGAPIFANLRGGPSVFAGPTGGYLVGMAVAAVVVGAIAVAARRRARLNFVSLLAAGLVSIPLIYTVGVPWLAFRLGLPILPPEGCSSIVDLSEQCVTGITLGLVPFLPGDIIKVVLAAGLAAVLHRAYPTLLPPARPRLDTSVNDAEPATA